MSEPVPFKPDNGERKALADDAQNLLDDKAFTAAILALRKRYFEILMGTQATDEKLSLIERIRALEDVPQQLRVFVNDERMAQRGKR